MNTSDLVSIGSRPLLPEAARTYDRTPKEILLARLEATFSNASEAFDARYETYQFEFPGDRTYERYLENRKSTQ
jgi:hypothetical protein